MNHLPAILSALILSATAPLQAAEDISPRQIFQRVGPGVVLIMAVDHSGSGEVGTGSIIDSTGYVLTNAHVILQGSTHQPFEVIHVYLKPAKLTGDPKTDMTNPLAAKVKSYDRDLDLALLELVNKPSALTSVPMGDASAVEAGDPVVAIGHPEQGGLWTLTQGVVSTVIANLGGVEGKNAFQTDASINRGNSGGPLLNNQGAMIGVNTSMARKAKDGLTITSVNFSIKSDVVKGWLAKNGPEVRYTAATETTGTEPTPVLRQSNAPGTAFYDGGKTLAPKNQEPAPTPVLRKSGAPGTVYYDDDRKLAPKPAPTKSEPKILTPVKPFNDKDLIQKEIAEMEDMAKEMQKEIDKRRESIGE